MLKIGVIPSVEPLTYEPVAKPLRLKIPSQSERIMEMVRYQQQLASQSGEFETFEEADDFEPEDGEEWFSPYEEVFEPDPDPFVDLAPPSPPGPAPGPPAPAPGAPTSDVPRVDP